MNEKRALSPAKVDAPRSRFGRLVAKPLPELVLHLVRPLWNGPEWVTYTVVDGEVLFTHDTPYGGYGLLRRRAPLGPRSHELAALISLAHSFSHVPDVKGARLVVGALVLPADGSPEVVSLVQAIRDLLHEALLDGKPQEDLY